MKGSLRVGWLLLGSLISVTAFSGFVLSSSVVSADNDTEVDRVNVSVPESCSMSGTGMNSHTATIANGTYQSDIGTTTLKAYCNDFEGFSIYTIGYTDDTDGKNVLTSSTISQEYDIETGTGTSGNSQWAMKLATVTSPTPTYPISIENSFNSYHTVPDDYTLVAKRTAATDTGSNPEGSTLTTTYQAYVAANQPAGTYTGQVKYVMVHPNYADKNTIKDAITVIFDGNGLTFPNGETTNTVKYSKVCEPAGTGYVGSPEISKTANIASNGTMDTYDTSTIPEEGTVTISGADMLKVELRYGFDYNGALYVFSGIPADDGDYEDDDTFYDYFWSSDWEFDNKKTSTTSFVIEGDTVKFITARRDEPSVDYYGYYAKVYPVYSTEQPNTTFETLPSDICSMRTISGAYAETTEWNNKWTAEINNTQVEFAPQYSEGEYSSTEQNLEKYLAYYFDDLKGTTITLHAFNPVTFDEAYLASNKTKTNGYYNIHDLNASMCSEVSEDEVTTVIDVRDNNTYEIGKLKDGNCWLMENLKLDPTDSTTAANMSASNTNATSTAIYNYLNGGNNNNNPGWTSVAVSSPSDWPANTFTYPYINASNSETYGAYYNYCAASIGTYCYEGNAGTLGNTEYDLCPAGWRLPVPGEVDLLNNSYTNILSSFNLIASGYYDPGSAVDDTDSIDEVGSVGSWWTSTSPAHDRVYTYMRRYNSFQWALSGQIFHSYRYSGNSIRCVLSTSN